jgi:predicted small secreted protein
MKRIFAFLAVAGLIVAAGCNTVRGAGQDLQSASNAVDNHM